MKKFRIPVLWLLFLLLLSGCGGSSGQNNSSAGQINSRQMGGAIQVNLAPLTGDVSTMIGALPGSPDGVGAAARFYNPDGIATDGENLYVADTGNQTIRKIVIATGMVTTLAGSAGNPGSTDGIGSMARFYSPSGITINGMDLFVTDVGNNSIRKVAIATGEVTTLAGSSGVWGADDGTGAAASFRGPTGITTNGTELFVADTANHTIRRVIIATGEVTTLAGIAQSHGSVDGTGTTAQFYYPTGVTVDGNNLYVADSYNYTIRKIDLGTAAVTTMAGVPGGFGSADGVGAAARFNMPNNIISDGPNLFVTDSGNSTIRKIVIATGEVTTVAGSAGHMGSADGVGASARFNYPRGIVSDGANLFVVDGSNFTIRKVIIASGEVSTLAGSPITGSTDGQATLARLNNPRGITTDGTNLFVADSHNFTIRKVVIATGEVTTLAGSAGNTNTTDGTGTAARFNFPQGITTDGTNLYVIDSGTTIRKIVISSGEVTTLAGSIFTSGSVDGVGLAANFDNLSGITTDGKSLFVVESGKSKIRKIK